MYNPIQAGARQAVTRCVRLESNERVVIKPTIHVENQIIMRDGEFCLRE